MLDQPTPPCLSMAALRAYNRAKWHDSTVLIDPQCAATEAREHGLCEQTAYTVADLRNKLSRKVDAQRDAPTAERARQICALSEEIAALKTNTRLDTALALTR